MSRENREEEIIYGVNAVLESLRSKKMGIHKIYLLEGRGGREISEIQQFARSGKLPIFTAGRIELDHIAGTSKHQGVVACLAAHVYSDLDEILRRATEGPGLPLLFVLDGIEDPRNLGAIIRTAEGVGAQGVIIPNRRAVGLVGVVSKASAGALAYLPVARVSNISMTLETLKKEGFWVVGIEADAKESYLQGDYRGPTVIVCGGESDGMHQKVMERCDQVLSLPMRGRISSLNVSVAMGVMAYEVLRQRGLKK